MHITFHKAYLSWSIREPLKRLAWLIRVAELISYNFQNILHFADISELAAAKNFVVSCILGYKIQSVTIQVLQAVGSVFPMGSALGSSSLNATSLLKVYTSQQWQLLNLPHLSSQSDPAY